VRTETLAPRPPPPAMAHGPIQEISREVDGGGVGELAGAVDAYMCGGLPYGEALTRVRAEYVRLLKTNCASHSEGVTGSHVAGCIGSGWIDP
jgi:hypothetical protein